jgi:glyoxylase-like metal-dependent hydrolase (beta-lactamase superfamily II)
MMLKIAALGLALLTLTAQARVDVPGLIKISDNVYVYQDWHSGAEKFTTNSLIVIRKNGVVVADGQGSAAATEGLVRAVATLTDKRITDVVICSEHGDHTGGNSAFPAGVRYYIHPNSQTTMKVAAPTLVTDETPVMEELLIGTPPSEPVIVRFLGRAHTGGDLTVWLPRQKILFMSETSFNHVFPAMRSAYPSEWVAAIDKALAIDADVYIPGHGFMVEAPKSRQTVVEYRAALAAVIAEATRLFKAGIPVEDAVKQANWGEYSTWTLAASQGPIAVRKVYEFLAK